MRAPSKSTMQKTGSLVIGGGLAVVTVLGFSSSAFQAADVNDANNWVVGPDEPGTDPGGMVTIETALKAPLFSAGIDGAPAPQWASSPTNAAFDAPLDAGGDAITGRDIDVTYDGRLPGDVRLFVDGFVDTGDLATETTVSVTADLDGDGDQDEVHSALLSEWPQDWASASDTAWATNGTGAEELTYTFSIETSADAAAGSTVSDLVFKWQAQERQA